MKYKDEFEARAHLNARILAEGNEGSEKAAKQNLHSRLVKKLTRWLKPRWV
jgi:dsRNA-specific ribonuclease